MGYYSDVRCLIYGPKDAMLRWTTAQRLDPKSPLNAWRDQFSEYLVDSGGDGTVVLDLHWDGVKWYDDYPTISAFGALLRAINDDSCSETPSGIEYEFIRVGEENGDIETDYSNSTEGWLFSRTIIETDLPRIINEEDPYGVLNESTEG